MTVYTNTQHTHASYCCITTFLKIQHVETIDIDYLTRFYRFSQVFLALGLLQGCSQVVGQVVAISGFDFTSKLIPNSLVWLLEGLSSSLAVDMRPPFLGTWLFHRAAHKQQLVSFQASDEKQTDTTCMCRGVCVCVCVYVCVYIDGGSLKWRQNCVLGILGS